MIWIGCVGRGSDPSEGEDPTEIQNDVTDPPPTTMDELITDSWVQADAPAVDVLWVIDDSCSMIEEQDVLANELSSFLGVLVVYISLAEQLPYR